MLLPRLLAPSRAVIACSRPSSIALAAASTRAFDVVRCAASNPISPSLTFVRHASHQTQGRANGAKDGPGKRLGAKKSGEEYVIPGNIIFRQRGTGWFAGENCAMGRDHTVYATEKGFVKYYRDPLKHPNRQYIGVAFKRDDSLPYPPNAARRRRLNMLAVQTTPEATTIIGEGRILEGDLTVKETKVNAMPRHKSGKELVMGKTYAFREANWQIGRAAENAGIKVRPFIPGDRFRAWQKSAARKAANAEKRGLRGKRGGGGKSKRK